MSAFPSYSTGIVAIAANATSVVGTGSNWSGQNAMSGDLLVVGGNTIIVQDVTDSLHLAIDPWPFAAVTAASYKLYKVSPLRFVGAQTAIQVDQLVSALAVNGFYVFVPPEASVPDPSLGQDGQFAFQAITGKLWEKVGGIWNFIGIQKGFSLPKPWDAVTNFQAFDVASDLGTSYVAIAPNTNQRPPNATFWTVLASKGDTGSQGIQGAGYACTSATSFAIGSGSKAFTTQAGLAWLPGARARVSSLAGGGVNYMEGVVTAYSGTTLTINVSKIVGTGTHADWQISLAGDPGSGDLLSTNNGSDFANVDTTLGNLRGVSFGASQALTATQKAQAQSNLGIAAIPRGYISGLTISNDAVTPNTVLDIAPGVATSDDNTFSLSLASAITKTTGAFTAGTGNGALDTGTIAAHWYNVFLIGKSSDGTTDVLFSLSSTSPTMPTGFDKKKRIGIRNFDGTKWLIIQQSGNENLFDSMQLNVNVTNPGTSAVLATVGPPIVAKLILSAMVQNTGAQRVALLVTSPDVSDTVPSTAANSSIITGLIGVAGASQGQMTVRSNSSGQIRYRVDASDANTKVFIAVVGWIDDL